MQTWLWAGFIALVLFMLVVDLVIVNRADRAVPMRRALAFTLVTVGLSMAFAVAIYFMYEHHWLGIGADASGKSLCSGRKAAEDFVQGWLLEYSLSVDNLFVFAVIFRHFRVAPEHQHRVLFWGIVGALLMRGVMIAAGIAAIRAFEPVLYLFGAFLIFTAFKLLRSGDEQFDPEASWLMRTARRVLPMAASGDGSRFLVREAPGSRLKATPLFLVLVVVEGTDVMFAVDSIPAVFGVTRDPFIVFSSNIFAIMGLRSLYFVLAGLMDKFRFLKISLAAVLAFVGVKMTLELPIEAWGYQGVHLPGAVSLSIIVGTLALGVAASWLISPPASHSPPARS